MQRAKAGFGIIFLILGAIIFATFMDGKVSAKFGQEPETEGQQTEASE